MYIKQLKYYNDNDCNKLINQLNFANTDEIIKFKQIISSEKKEDIEKEFEFLKIVGMINGIGPGFFGKKFRKILTRLFPGVKYEWHDISRFLGGTELDRLKSDYGLLKYSFLDIGKKTKKIYKWDMNFIFKIIIIPIYITLIIPIILFCFIMVVICPCTFNYKKND